jgi:hypothetical protein
MRVETVLNSKRQMDELLKELVDLIEQLADRETWLKRVVDLK